MSNSARLIRGGLSRTEIDALNAEAWQIRRTRPPRAAELCRLTRARAEETAYRRGVGQALVVEGFLAYATNRIDTALSCSLDALADLEPDGPTTWLAWAHMTIAHVAAAVDERDRATAHYALAGRTAGDADDLEAATAAQLNAIIMVLDPAEQLGPLQALVDRLEADKAPVGLAIARFNLAECLYENGRYDEAVERAAQVMEDDGDDGLTTVRLLAATARARCLLAQSRPEAARSILAGTLVDEPAADADARGAAGGLLADLQRAAGDTFAAIATLDATREALASPAAGRVDILQTLADLYAEIEDYDAAYTTLRELQDERQALSAEQTRRRTAILEILYRSSEQSPDTQLPAVDELAPRPDEDQAVLRDELTGLPDARRLDRELAGIGSSTQRRPVSLALIDIDELSVVNAELGHLVGDTALRQVAEVLEDAVPEGSLLARVDGEDFALVLDGVGLEQAAAACEELRTRVARHPLSPELHGRRFTVSIGVASATTPFDAVRLVRLADDALYEAKDAGRNRVVTRPPDPERAQA